MFRAALFATLGIRRRVGSASFLLASELDPLLECRGVVESQRRCFGGKKKGPGKRSQYALRRKEEIQGYKQSPFGIQGRPVKQFDELKFYHARNKYGQKETLVDSRRRDIEFFDPVAGGFERDPRSRYRGEDLDEEIHDEEAALYADFTDTDDDDIYFGGGKDEDGDYDDTGKELRPKKRTNKKATWADDDPPLMEAEAETDVDEEEREFNEVFGPRSKRSLPKKPPKKSKGGFKGDKKSKVDPELGIDDVTFRRRFEKAANAKTSPAEHNFSPDAFLKDKMSSDDEVDSEMDEARMVQAGDEELEELTDVSDMIRDYGRPSRSAQMEEITEEMAEEAKKREMASGEYYASDDVEVPHAEDPELHREIAEEHDANIKRLKSTSGGRKLFKQLNRDAAWMEDFPPSDKRLYENALRETPHEAPVKPPKERRQRKQPAKAVFRFVERDEPLAAAAPSKRRDAWRTLSAQFDEEGQDSNFLADLRE